MRTNRAALAFSVLAAATAYVAVAQYRIDLDVYRIGAEAVLHGQDLYGPLPATRDGLALPFTYPPAAALLFVPLRLAPFPMASLGVTVVSIASLAAALALVRARLDSPARLPRDSTQTATSAFDRRTPLLLLLLVALLLEPVRSTLGYGQINLMLMAMVCADLLLPRPPWPRGLLIGVAAAVKLTPAGFVLALIVLKQWRAAGTAVATFVAVSGAACLLLPADSYEYWTTTLWDPGRIGGATYAGNQSLKATILRADVAPALTQIAHLVAVLACLALAVVAMRRAARQDRPVLVVGLNALLILLVSPVSWTHHWVWLTVVLLCLWHEGGTGWRVLAGAGLALALTSPMRWLPREHDRELHWLPWQVILGNAYVLYGALVIVAVLVTKGPDIRGPGSEPRGEAEARGSARGSRGGLHVPDARGQVGEGVDPVVAEVVVQAERVHQDGSHPCPARSGDIDRRHVADVPGICGVDAHRLGRHREDARVGLHHPDGTRVDDAFDLDACARPDLEDLQGPQALPDQAVGVGDDAQAHAGVRERLQALPAPGDHAQPEPGVGELAVDVVVGLFEIVLGDAALREVALEVAAPGPGPVAFYVEVHHEPRRAAVVRVVEDLGVHLALGTAQRGRDPIVLGQEEDAADVEQDGMGAGRGHAAHRTDRGVTVDDAADRAAALLGPGEGRPRQRARTLVEIATRVVRLGS